MELQEKVWRITIYLSESDQQRGQALYMALLELLKRQGAAGATVSRGLAGFGARSQIHTATILTLSEDLPLQVEWIDTPETVTRLLPQVRELVPDALITSEEIQVVQYAARIPAAALAQPIGAIMRRHVTAIGPETPATEIVKLLLQQGYGSLPVVDAGRHIVGIITDGDLLLRAQLTARLDLQEELSQSQVQRQVAALQAQKLTAADIMTATVVTLEQEASVREAMGRMVAHGLKRLPVVDGEQQLVGWVSRVDILRTMERHHQPLVSGSAPAAGRTVAELMYREVPTVAAQSTIEEILQALEAGPYRRAVVVDNEKRVVGIITDGDVVRRSRGSEHPGLLARLRSLVTGQPAAIALPDTNETAADLMTAPVLTITVDTSLPRALRLMLDNRVKRLPVVDEEGRLLGLLGRRNLLRGLLDEEEG